MRPSDFTLAGNFRSICVHLATTSDLDKRFYFYDKWEKNARLTCVFRASGARATSGHGSFLEVVEVSVRDQKPSCVLMGGLWNQNFSRTYVAREFLGVFFPIKYRRMEVRPVVSEA